VVILAGVSAPLGADKPAPKSAGDSILETVAKAVPGPAASEISICPAPLPRQALAYRLLPGYLERTPGNAAPLYGKVFLMLANKRGQDKSSDAKIVQWLHTPVDSLPRDDVRHLP
jgi:hypothetical protein